MKKIIITLSLIILILAFTGCKKEEVTMPVNVEKNTLFVEKDGIVELALVEEFNKDYYDIDELKEFADNYINDYNASQGQKVAILADANSHKGNAMLNIRFKNMKEYAKYQEVDADNFNIEEANDDDLKKLPDTLISIKKKKTVNKEDYIKNKEIKIIIVNDDIDLLVDGTILFYSDNIDFKNKYKAEIKKGQESIIIYK